MITVDCVNEVEHPAAWFAMAKAATEILDDIFFVQKKSSSLLHEHFWSRYTYEISISCTGWIWRARECRPTMPTAAKARGIPCEKCGAGLTLEDDQL